MISCDNNGINTQTLNGGKNKYKYKFEASGRQWNMEQISEILFKNSKLELVVVCRLSYAGWIDSELFIQFTRKSWFFYNASALFLVYINKFLILFSASPVF